MFGQAMYTLYSCKQGVFVGDLHALTELQSCIPLPLVFHNRCMSVGGLPYTFYTHANREYVDSLAHS